MRPRTAALALFLFALSGSAAHATPPRHGFAFMDVRERSAVFWTRAGDEGTVVLTLTPPRGRSIHRRIDIDAEHDRVASAEVSGLAPDTLYRVEVRVPSGEGEDWRGHGRLRTAPPRPEAAAFRVAFGGDVGGQGVCRDQKLGYPIFRVIARRETAFFVGLGDMIYADNACRATGRYGNPQVEGPIAPAADPEGFRARWRYNRSDPGWVGLSAQVGYVPVWDDHEVLNDFGPEHDSPRGRPDLHLLKTGLTAFLEYNPISTQAKHRLYRHLRWGKHLDLFVLDTRQHRDSNARKDSLSMPKTMLGRDQREWLLGSLTISDATWNVVVSSVPIAIPTGAFPDPENGRDGWASGDRGTGFEHELRQLLMDLYDAGVRNLVWITTDVHFASVQRFQPFTSRPEYQVYEVATGPLNAGVFPNSEMDESFHPERLFRWPPMEGADMDFEITSFDDAQRWFNFGELEFDAAGNLTLRVVNGRGEVVYEHTLPPASRPELAPPIGPEGIPAPTINGGRGGAPSGPG